MLSAFAVGYIATLVIFLVCWKRHFDRLHALDAAERRIRHEQEHEPVADDLRAAELSHAHRVSQ